MCGGIRPDALFFSDAMVGVVCSRGAHAQRAKDQQRGKMNSSLSLSLSLSRLHLW